MATTVLTFFSKEKVSRLAGYFAIKPIVVYSISLLNWFYFDARWNPSQSWTLWLIFHFSLELGLLLVIIFGFRDLYENSYKLPWLFAGFDAVRWGSLLGLLLASKLFALDLINTYTIDFIYFETTFSTTLFAIFALLLAFTRRKKLQTTQGKV
jgi:hypothetical protein